MTLPKVGLNMKVQPNSKAKVEVVRQGNPSETPASNGYTKDQLKGAGWSDDQINQAVKAGKITLR